jgi:hypothetical protein
MAVESGVIFSEDPLADPEFEDATKDIPDEDYFYNLTPEEVAEFDAQKASKGPAERMFITLADDRNTVVGLIREEIDSGTYFVRRSGEWVKVEPDVEAPELDELELVQVFGDITGQWDLAVSGGGSLVLPSFSAYI